MSPLNVREWLQARRIAGCEYADHLLDLVEGEDEANENAAALEDLWEQAPDDVKKSGDLWRLIELIGSRLAVLEEVDEILDEHAADFKTGNGAPFEDAADKLRAMFESGRWLEHDL